MISYNKFTYNEITDFNNLLNKAYDIFQQKNNPIENIVIPSIVYESYPTKFYWKNISNILSIINRSPDHFIIFLKYELKNKEINWLSKDYNDGIIVQAKYQKVQELNELLKKYINNYVLCDSCKSNKTELSKISKFNYTMTCLTCMTTKTCSILK